MTVIGFMTYEDFRNEVLNAGIQVVRMQDYYREYRDREGMTWLLFFAELAATKGAEIYVVRFMTGEVLYRPGEKSAMAQEVEEVWDQTRALMDSLRHDLEAHGIRVQTGMVAGTLETPVIAAHPRGEAHHPLRREEIQEAMERARRLRQPGEAHPGPRPEDGERPEG